MNYKPHGRIWLEKGIVFTEYPPEYKMTLELAREGVEERLSISGGVTRPLLADVRNLKRVDDAAMKFLASEEAVQYLSAIAIVKETPIQNLFANFYLKFDKPRVPTRLFSAMDKALRWLELFKDKTLN